MKEKQEMSIKKKNNKNIQEADLANSPTLNNIATHKINTITSFLKLE